MERWLFMGLILLIGLAAKNLSLVVATGFVLVLMLIPTAQGLFPWLQLKGINLGVTVITISILVPIATGQIGFKELIDAFKSPLGWIGVACGILVARLAARGVDLIAADPQVTVALTLGTIIGVVCLKGVAAGPVIAAGITYWLLQGLSHFMS